MSTPAQQTLAGLIARGHTGCQGGLLRVRRAWPADLRAPGNGYVAELAGPPGLAGARIGADGELTVLSADTALPALAAALGEGGCLTGYRAGKRAVLEMPDGSYRKVARPGATARAVQRAGAVSALLAAAADPAAPVLPQLLAADARAGWLQLAAAPGTPLGTGSAGQGTARAAPEVITPVARALTAIAAVSYEPRAGLPVHTAADEARVLLSWVRAALAAAPAGRLTGAVAARLRIRAGGVARQLRALDDIPPGRLALTHRDLHDGQVLVVPGHSPAVTILDWDTACWSRPALDPANLLAHVDRAAALGGTVPGGSSLGGLLRATGHPGAADPDELELLRTAARLRTFAVHAFRPGPLDLAALD